MNDTLKKFFEDYEIKLVSAEEILEVVNDYENEDHEPAGLLLAREEKNGKETWTACDDDDGQAFTETFDHLQTALLYLTTNLEVQYLYEFDKI